MATQEGGLFSRQHLDLGAARPDSDRFRIRVHATIESYVHAGLHNDIAHSISSALGVNIPNFGTGYVYRRFFEEAERDTRKVRESL